MPKRRRSIPPLSEDGDGDTHRKLQPNPEEVANITQRFVAYVCGWRDEVANEATTTTIETQPTTTTLAHPPSTMPPLKPIIAAVAASSPPYVLANGTASTAVGTGFVVDERMSRHKSADPAEFERPARIDRTMEHLECVGLLRCCHRLPSRTATRRELRRVHTRDHVDYVEQLDFFMELREEKGGSVGQDLYACAETSLAARLAAGCAVEAATAVMKDQLRNAFAMVRPPGHHAAPENASGFCFINNAAVAARAAQEAWRTRSLAAAPADGDVVEPPRARVLILDWDVHHCDGTERVFYDDPSVLVISIHQYGNKKGHVLRKKHTTPPQPTTTTDTAAAADGVAANGEELSMDALAELLGDEDGVEAQQAASSQQQQQQQPSANTMNEDSDLRPRRPRAAVDYGKLASTLHIDDDDALAFFGSPAAASSSSSYSSSTCSNASSVAPAPPVAPHYAGDSAGCSTDREPSAEAEPFYPGSGHLHQIGGAEVPEARGRNINIPWPTHGMGDVEYLQVMEEVVLPVGKEFDPHLVLVSCGFDSARGDLLGSMELSISGYHAMTHLLCEAFARVVVVLEGGYNVSNVARGSEGVLRALLEANGSTTAEELPPTRMLRHQTEEMIERIRQEHGPYWKCLRSGEA